MDKKMRYQIDIEVASDFIGYNSIPEEIFIMIQEGIDRRKRYLERLARGTSNNAREYSKEMTSAFALPTIAWKCLDCDSEWIVDEEVKCFNCKSNKVKRVKS